MLENLKFSFENDFQKLCLEVRVSQHSSESKNSECKKHKIEYRVIGLSNVDFVCASDSWVSFSGDSDKWLERFDLIDIQDWKSFYDVTNNPFPDSETKWNLCVEFVEEDADAGTEDFKKEKEGKFSINKNENSRISKSIYGHNLYPTNFDSFLYLLRDLLNIPVLLLEL